MFKKNMAARILDYNVFDGANIRNENNTIVYSYLFLPLTALQLVTASVNCCEVPFPPGQGPDLQV